MNPQALWNFAFKHLQELRTDYGFAASDASTGLYHTLFGRDSLWILIFLLQTVKNQPLFAFNTWVEKAGSDVLLSLCKYQGTTDNPHNEEQPGKIIHEFRDEAAQREQRLEEMGLGFVEGRLYSGFDQTFLFISAFRQFNEIFPQSQILEQIWPHVERALSWIEKYADSDQDGFFEYTRRNPKNLLNQVWKDSFDSIATTGVDVPPHPLAWIEVQAYAYRALLDAAHLFETQRWKNEARASHLRKWATELQQRVHSYFWIANEDCFAIALSAEKNPNGTKKKIKIISSNAGHTLWAGIVDGTRVPLLVERLMKPDITTQFGLRTVSSNSPFYAPFTYHRGSIWPFDNAIFVIGLLKHGYTDEALHIVRGVSSALLTIGSPIELYAVLDADIFLQPQLSMPQALVLRRSNQENRNQGWTAAALLYFASILAMESEIILADM